METTAYTQHPEVLALLDDLHVFAASQPEGQLNLSDVVDDQGYQYVDLVLEGGGTLGVALLGYVYVLEQMNIRFLQLAGTSAGSIVSMLLAGGGPIDAAKSEWLIREVAGKDFSDFMDGDKDVQHFLDALLDPDSKKRKVARYSSKIMDDVKECYGLNPGLHFQEWLSGLLQAKGVYTLRDLKALRQLTPAGLRHRLDGTAYGPGRFERVAVVTAEVTTETKVVFPDLAPLYYADPESVDPAEFVRASMSVPVLFYPYIAKNLPNTTDSPALWQQLANYKGPIPTEAYFVDGGTLSNFPISLFHNNQSVPSAPTFGVKIGIDRDTYNKNESFGDFFGATLNAMMAYGDNDFIVQHPDYRRLIGFIDSGDYNWMDFSISEEGKLDLFVRGARAAADFLKNFNWVAYKDLRAKLLEMNAVFA
ncbi:MAG: patatin-like phospholipase family protein [Saprospiraceae bacterium]|nr:patatin-like phospholipase family protein [Saprospiraceae bacterium]